MIPVVMLVFFVGCFLIMQGVHEQKYAALRKNVRVEYRFVPRTLLDEQLASSNVQSKFKTMFAGESPWFERSVSSPGQVKKT